MSRHCLWILVFSMTSIAIAQGVPSSNPQAVSIAAQSVVAMAGGATISDVTLSGTASWTVGSDQQTSTITLLAKGFAESRADLNLSGGTRSEIRNANANPNEGNWIGPDGAVHAIALHNCFTDPSWFFPALGTLAAAATNNNIVLTYVGLEDLGQGSVQHVHAYTYYSYFSESQQLSAMDFYLDAQTFLPLMVTFNEHPDADSTTNIAVQVLFSDYRSANGASVPFHIQRFVNNTLLLDIQLGSSTINSGIADNIFSVQ